MKTASEVSFTPRDIFRLVEEDLGKVEARLKEMSPSAVPVINDINNYVHDSGGKRLRPAIVLLSSRLCGAEGDAPIQLGVVVELIHAATLIHDDIIDGAELRRGLPSVNARWGNPITVLVGDWLYMTAFHLALALRDFRILDLLIGITRKMVEGELMQLACNWRVDISVEQQLEICSRKTADLFSGCSRLGAFLAGTDSGRENRLGVYGRSLGMAFQLVDDILDYTSNETVLGKPVLKDLEEGKATLPIIYLMQRADRAERRFIERVVQAQDFSSENKKKIIRLVRAYQTLAETQTLAERFAQEARSTLLDFPDSIYKEALLKVPEFILNRNH